MLPFKKFIYQEIQRGVPALLVGDIGGTNSNFGIAQIMEGDARLLFSLHVKSQDVTHFTDLVKDVLAYVRTTYALEIKSACFAAAGVVAPRQRILQAEQLEDND